jgi:16S rRNA processing protein RimM
VSKAAQRQIESLKQRSGSPQPGRCYVVIGRIARAHGVSGELAVDVLTDFPERFDELAQVWLGQSSTEATPYVVTQSRKHKNRVLLTLEGITTKDQADLMHGVLVQIPADDLEALPEGQYYAHELLGVSVVDEEGEELGELAEILETGANDVYIIRGPKGELLVPAIPEVILKIDMENRLMRIHVLDGLR